jgi:hypothetical protein
MLDIINPWGALWRARQLIAELLADIEELEEEQEYAFTEYKAVMEQLEAADALIAQGHFRNPETGRLGRKGEVFDV